MLDFPSCRSRPAATEQATYNKAHNRGCMIEARVYLGKIKQITKAQIAQHTLQSLQQEGYDSIYVTAMSRGTGTSYLDGNRSGYGSCGTWPRGLKYSPSPERAGRESGVGFSSVCVCVCFCVCVCLLFCIHLLLRY
mmetsp:Transcript_42697/g.106665  ORF Transcript_42697/g.106665 Transcript_42697/m.106665 type:complete len:136 (+) Transcript_42697:327-734(+)